MTEIFKAQASAPLPATVAIKRLRSKYMYDSEFIEMLRSEAHTLENLEHANLIRIFGFFQEGPIPYIVMEYVDGKSLLSTFNKLEAAKQTLSIPAIIYIAREVCSALDYLHQVPGFSKNIEKLLHTDLSERNILIDRAGAVKVIDFSAQQCAHNLEDNVTQGHWGLLQEMAPERLKGKQIDVESDIFQLGLILYRQLTGKHLFEGKAGFWLYMAISEVDVSEKTLPENWDADLKMLLTQSLARDPKDRFSTAKLFRSRLDEYLKKYFPNYGATDLAREISAIPDPPPEKTIKQTP